MGCSSLTAVETFHFPASHQKLQYSVQTINAVLDTDSRQTLHLQQNIFAKDSCGRQTVHQKRIPNHLAYRLCESLTREVSNTRGKLTIRMDGSYSTSGNSLTAFFSAMGNWSGTGSDPSACPSSGADVAGFHWGGNISTGETTARGEYGDNSSATVTLAGGTSNEAIAWYFTEKEAFKYIKNVFFNLNMSKSSLTGNGNTTELYFTYIHTYQSYNVTGSISASGAGISISNVANQWPLSVRLYGIPY